MLPVHVPISPCCCCAAASTEDNNAPATITIRASHRITVGWCALQFRLSTALPHGCPVQGNLLFVDPDTTIGPLGRAYPGHPRLPVSCRSRLSRRGCPDQVRAKRVLSCAARYEAPCRVVSIAEPDSPRSRAGKACFKLYNRFTMLHLALSQLPIRTGVDRGRAQRASSRFTMLPNKMPSNMGDGGRPRFKIRIEGQTVTAAAP